MSIRSSCKSTPGAVTLWGSADDDYGDLHLKAASPAIDVGSNAGVTAGTTLDLDGHPRFVDVAGIHDPGVIVDMGPYEATATLAASSGAYQSGITAPFTTISFNENLTSSTIQAGDLSISNVDTGQPVDVAGSTIATYDPTNFAGIWTFTTPLPDGNYHATLAASSVTDAAGSALPNSYSFDFFSLLADANHDRHVDTSDFMLLANNFGKAGVGFGKGDFNYDGVVNALDFNILATNFGNTLAPASAPVPDAPIVALSATLRANLFSDRSVESAADPRDLLTSDPLYN